MLLNGVFLEQTVQLPISNWSIGQKSHGHKVTSDVNHLVDVIRQTVKGKNLSLLDVGCGNGIVAIMLSLLENSWRIVGIDIQKELVELAQRNSKQCKVEIDFLVGDIRYFKFDNKFDIIVSNPPYFPENIGRIPRSSQRAISRFELTLTMNNLISFIKKNLDETGTSFVMYPHWRLKELKKTVESNKLTLESVSKLKKSFVGVLKKV